MPLFYCLKNNLKKLKITVYKPFVLWYDIYKVKTNKKI